MKNYKIRTISALKWSTVNQGLSQITNLLISIILARLLQPDDFGLLAMVLVFVGFANNILDFGLGASVIRNQKVKQIEYLTLFWINVGLGILLFSLFQVLAGPIAMFYDKEVLENLTRVLSFIFIISALIIVPTKIFQKKLQFKKLMIISFASNTLAGIIAIILAIQGFGVWSLVGLHLSRRLIELPLVYAFSEWRPGFNFSISSLKSHWNFSFSLLGNNAFNHFVRNIDNLLIGKFLGDSMLGLYSKAYSFLMLPVGNVGAIIGNVLFPSFSIIQNDKKRLRSIFFKAAKSVVLFTFPLMTGFFVLADNFVIVVLGVQWIGAIPIIKVFAILGAFQSFGVLISNIYLSQGRADTMFYYGIPLKLLLVSGIVIGLNWGIIGVAIGYTIAGIISNIINYSIAGRLVNFTYIQLIMNFLKILLSSLLMGIILITLKSNFLKATDSISNFLILVLSGIVIYCLAILMMKENIVKEITKEVLNKS